MTRGVGSGFTLIDTVFALGLAALLLGIAVPAALAGLDQRQAREAARFLAGRMALARGEAVASGRHVGLRFDPDGAFTQYADGNDNGIRTRDIARGLDEATRAPVRLAQRFPGVDIRLRSAGGQPADPVRFGAADILSFAPSGSATSGSVYVRGRNGSQFVVRVLGATGRARVLRWSDRSGEWVPLR